MPPGFQPGAFFDNGRQKAWGSLNSCRGYFAEMNKLRPPRAKSEDFFEGFFHFMAKALTFAVPN